MYNMYQQGTDAPVKAQTELQLTLSSSDARMGAAAELRAYGAHMVCGAAEQDIVNTIQKSKFDKSA